jgi:uncharacterized membrane protein
LSGDGQVLVGITYDDVPLVPARGGASSGTLRPTQVSTWSRAAGVRSLPGVPEGVDVSSPEVNADGHVIGLYVGEQGMLWKDGILQPMRLPPGVDSGGMTGLSADGRSFVGRFSTQSGSGSFWATGDRVLVIDTPSDTGNEVEAISRDGRTVAGTLLSQLGSCSQQAYRWSEAAGLSLLSPCSSHAYDIDADGAVVVGSVDGPRMALWREGEPEILGGEPSVAFAVNADASVIAGVHAARAVIWTREGGVQPLADILGERGVDLTGWQLGEVTDISDDGKTLVGIGELDGVFRTFVAHLP